MNGRFVIEMVIASQVRHIFQRAIDNTGFWIILESAVPFELSKLMKNKTVFVITHDENKNTKILYNLILYILYILMVISCII